MMDKWKIAWEIYGALKLAGADIGNASVPIIGKVLGEYIEDEVPGEVARRGLDLNKPEIVEEINIGDLGDFDLYHPFLG